MRVHIDIDFQLSRRQRTLAWIVPALLAIGSVGIVNATPEQFSEGETLTADKLNANFNGLHDRLDDLEAIAFSGSSGVFTTTSTTPVVIPNSEVQLETNGGLVRLELAPAASAGNSRLWLAGTASTYLWAYITIERASSASGPWLPLTTADFGGPPNGTNSTVVPPGAFTQYDDPTPGTAFYRATVNVYTAAMTVHVDNVRLVARKVGPSP